MPSNLNPGNWSGLTWARNLGVGFGVSFVANTAALWAYEDVARDGVRVLLGEGAELGEAAICVGTALLTINGTAAITAYAFQGFMSLVSTCCKANPGAERQRLYDDGPA